MRINKSKLKKIIKEETEKLAQEISQEDVPSKFYDMGETTIYGDASIADVAATGRPLAGTSKEAEEAFAKAGQRAKINKAYALSQFDSPAWGAHQKKENATIKRIGNWLSNSTEEQRKQAGWKRDISGIGWKSPDGSYWRDYTPEERLAQKGLANPLSPSMNAHAGPSFKWWGPKKTKK